MSAIPLNLTLMSNPANWFIITLMVLTAGIALGLVMHPSHLEGDNQ